MTTPFTPGPWSISCNQVQSPKLNDYGNWIVSSIDRDLTLQDTANLQLLVAAPEMLELLQAIWLRLEMEPASSVFPCSAMRWDIRDIIAKATGNPA